MAKTTYTMEMSGADRFVGSERDMPDFSVLRVTEPYAELAKFLHTLVGSLWRWGGRDGWGEAEWETYCTQPGFEMWLAYRAGTPVGYFELCKHRGGDVQILTMGLVPRFIGQGLGGPLLTAVVDRAWKLGATKVWLRTCSHDHPRARENYEKVGFEVARVEEGPENPPIPSFWALIAGK